MPFWVTAAATVIGVASSADSSRRASNTQRDSAREAQNYNERMYQQNRQDYAPLRNAGNYALSRMMGGMGGGNYRGADGLGGYGGGGRISNVGGSPRPGHGMPGRDGYQAYQFEQMNGQGTKVGDPSQPTPAQTQLWRGGGVQGGGQIPLSQLGASGQQQGSDPTMAPDYFTRAFGAQDFQQDPGYQFRMNQGMEAIENSAAARGGLVGGNTGRALQEYGQNFASNEYQNAYNRFNNDRTTNYNRFASMANLGQTATRDVANMGQQSAYNQGQYGMQGANARAAGQMGQSNAWSGGLNSLANNWQRRQMMEDQGGGGNSGGWDIGGYSDSRGYMDSYTGGQEF